MLKNAFVALAALVFSFFIAGVVVTHAQTPTTTPTTMMNSTTNETVTPRIPSNAPDTGFGGLAK